MKDFSTMKELFIKLLMDLNVEGMAGLIDEMEVGGFFTAPCSGKHHLCYEGGLLEHSLNVYEHMCKLVAALEPGDITEEDIVICSLLHDLGKMGDYGKPNYVPNVLKTGVSKAQPYKTNPDLTYEEHEIRSITIAKPHINLTEKQYTAILHHNGLFGKLDSSFGNHNYDSSTLSFLLHTADMYCSRFVELEDEE